MSKLAVMNQALGRYEDAVETAERVLQINRLLPANLVLGLSLIRVNRAAESITPIERVRTREPANRDAILGLAAARVALNELDAAVEL